MAREFDVSMRDEGLANCPGRLKPTPPCMSLSPVHAGLVYITIAVESKHDNNDSQVRWAHCLSGDA